MSTTQEIDHQTKIKDQEIDIKSKNEDQPDDNIIENGPIEGVEYPLKIIYCGVCTLPIEYCQHSSSYEKCKEWLEVNFKEEFEKLNLNDHSDEKSKSRQKRGGKGLPKTKKKDVNKKVELFRLNRGKKKYITVVRGLSTFEVDLKEASKLFASKFACGSSITNVDEIVVQGDFKEDLIDLILEKWPHIDEESIEDLGDKK